MACNIFACSISSTERGFRTNAHMIQDSRQIFKMFARAWTYHNTWCHVRISARETVVAAEGGAALS